ncbi:MAG: hypothetical protein AB9834_05960 [Lentimicrobium sp.]
MEAFLTRGKPLFAISFALLTFMIVQSLGGIIISDLYYDSDEIIASWRGNDLVTLFIAVPVFILAIIYTQKASVFAKYTWFAMLFYTFYNNCYYLFGASLNYFFFIYIAIFILSLISILIVAANFYILPIESDFNSSNTLRIAVVISLFIFGIIMSGMWVSEYVKFAFYGIKPVIPGMNEGYRIVAAMDLAIQVPVMFIGAVMLWRRKALGYLLSFVSTISNTVYIVVLLVFCPFAEKAGLVKAWDGFLLFFLLFILCLISSTLFFRNTLQKVSKA